MKKYRFSREDILHRLSEQILHLENLKEDVSCTKYNLENSFIDMNDLENMLEINEGRKKISKKMESYIKNLQKKQFDLADQAERTQALINYLSLLKDQLTQIK